jgi:hypothetical protein
MKAVRAFAAAAIISAAGCTETASSGNVTLPGEWNVVGSGIDALMILHDAQLSQDALADSLALGLEIEAAAAGSGVFTYGGGAGYQVNCGMIRYRTAPTVTTRIQCFGTTDPVGIRFTVTGSDFTRGDSWAGGVSGFAFPGVTQTPAFTSAVQVFR